MIKKKKTKKKKMILLKMLDQIQQDNEDARDGTEKSIATICNEEGISFEQVFYMLVFDVLFIIILQLLE